MTVDNAPRALSLVLTVKGLALNVVQSNTAGRVFGPAADGSSAEAELLAQRHYDGAPGSHGLGDDARAPGAGKTQ
jgi:hypothetical protein